MSRLSIGKLLAKGLDTFGSIITESTLLDGHLTGKSYFVFPSKFIDISIHDLSFVIQNSEPRWEQCGS